MTKKNDEKLYRRYTVRLFPTPEQEELMWKHIHACRFVWNYMLELQEARYKNGKKHIVSAYEMSRELVLMKKQCEFEWLNEVSSHCLAIVCQELEYAYKRFFKKTANMPKFKSKKTAKISYPLRPDVNATYFMDDKYFVCPKIGKIKYKTDRNVPIGRKLRGHNEIIKPRIKYIKSSGKWILTFAVGCDKQTSGLIDKSMGIDLGVKELAVVAVGDKKLVFHNINKSKRMRQLEKKRKYIQRVIDRKYKTYNGFSTPNKGQTWKKSKNIEKYEQMLREIEAKMANIRHNYIHQITRQLTNISPERVVMEDLNITGMLKNKYLASSISKQNFGLFIRTMKYKCEEYGVEFVLVNRFYPSSKTCSDCGHIKRDLKLKDRTYICPVCGLEIDRDYNAAINLMNYTEKISTTANNLVSTKLSA